MSRPSLNSIEILIGSSLAGKEEFWRVARMIDKLVNDKLEEAAKISEISLAHPHERTALIRGLKHVRKDQ